MTDQKSLKNLQKLFTQRTLLDIMVEVEKFFDFLDLYIYPNWFDGEIVEGPNVGRYWITLVLRFPYKKMPDPMGARVMHDIGVRVKYTQDIMMVPVEIKKPSDFLPGTKKPKMVEEKIWHVEIKVPRRFIDDIDYNELDDYDETIDIDDIENAKDSGMNIDKEKPQLSPENTEGGMDV